MKEDVDDVWQGRLIKERCVGFAGCAQRLRQAHDFLRHERPPECARGDALEEMELAVPSRGWGQRVELHIAAGSKPDRHDSEGRGQRLVFALDVDHPRTPAEHMLPPEVCLDERRLGAADDPGDE